MKRLAVFIDGTWNLPHNNTNVWRLRMLTETHGPQVPQLCFYHRGIGTSRTDRVRGAFGKGINSRVRNCYAWLVEHYSPGDEIFIFGFSRGAYIARSLTGFIARCGLLTAGSPLSTDEVFERYRGTGRTAGLHRPDSPAHEWPINTDPALRRYSHVADIAFLGLWDTVRYHDVPLGNIRGVSRNQNIFHAIEPAPTVRRIRHALAIDENRSAYKPELLHPDTESLADRDRVEQRWFAGAHSNVGGGYRNDTLAMIPLAWMQRSAAEAGLEFKHPVHLHGDEYLGEIVDSFTDFMGGGYRLASRKRRYWRPIDASLGDDRAWPASTQTIDETVLRRWRERPDYRPANLATWAQRHDIDLDGQTDTASATDCS